MKAQLAVLLLVVAIVAPRFVVANDEPENHPCKAIKAACEAAGFKKGGHKEGNKGLWKDCVGPLKDGKTVAGVNVTPEQVAACKAKREKYKK